MEFPHHMYGAVGVLKLVQYSLNVGALVALSSIPSSKVGLPQHLILLHILALPFFSVLMIIFAKYNFFSSSVVGIQIANITGCVLWTVSAVGAIAYNFIVTPPTHPFNLKTVVLILIILITIFVIIEIFLFIFIIHIRRNEIKKKKARQTEVDYRGLSLYKRSFRSSQPILKSVVEKETEDKLREDFFEGTGEENEVSCVYGTGAQYQLHKNTESDELRKTAQHILEEVIVEAEKVCVAPGIPQILQKQADDLRQLRENATAAVEGIIFEAEKQCAEQTVDLNYE